MITIIILIILDLFLHEMLKAKKNEIEKENLNYIKKKQYKEIKSYNISIRIILFTVLYLAIWLTISFFVNKYLIDNFESSLSTGLLKYNVISKQSLQPIEDMEEEIYVLGYETFENDLAKYRAYYYVLKDKTVSKSISSSVMLNITEEKTNYETDGNIVYDKFLRLFFFQFYSYQFKQVYCQEQYIDFLEFNQEVE